MKKRIIFKSILSIIIIALISICGFFSTNNETQVALAEDEQKIVEELTQDVSFRQLYDRLHSLNFDVFNGKGYTVRSDEDINSYTMSLFGEINDAEIYNLKFEGITLHVYNRRQLGILAETINNSTIRGVEFLNCNILIRCSEEYPLVETGFVAGKIENSSIVDQIALTNCKIELLTDEGVQVDEFGNVIEKITYFDNNLYAGFVAGSITAGTTIRNSIVTASSMELLQFKNDLSQDNNIGGLVGYMEAGSIINNIVDLGIDAIKLDSEVKKTVYVGALAGKINNNVIEIFNNIVCFDNSINYNLDIITTNYGILIGKLEKQIDASRIEGFITTSNDNLIGNKSNNDVLLTYNKINTIERKQLDLNVFLANKYSQYWKEEGNTKWDFDSIWLKGTLNNLPTLQIFNIYSASFSEKQSLDSLKLETLPTIEEGNIIEALINDSNEEITDIKYGTSIVVKAKITNQKNYNKFFSVAGLRINGVLVYTIGDANENIKLLNEIDEESGELILNDGYVEFEVSNFVAGNSGVYSVELKSNKFNINIKVLGITDELGNVTIPGKVKNNLAVESFEEINNIEMQYGYKYTYETVITNTDYSDIAYWYLVDTNSESFILEDFDYKNEITQFSQTKRFSWTFNENCELFATLNGATTYDVTKEGASYTLLVAFPQTVRTLEIAFKDADGENIKEKIADISIDGDDSRIVWNEEQGVYTAKIAYDKKDHVIKIEMLDVNYEFIAWYEGVNSVLRVEMEGTMTGVFKVSSSNNMDEDLAETLNLHCRVNKQKSNTSLIWLWITLACVGVALVVIVIIIIIKKRRGGGGGSTSYKKQFYY